MGRRYIGAKIANVSKGIFGHPTLCPALRRQRSSPASDGMAVPSTSPTSKDLNNSPNIWMAKSQTVTTIPGRRTARLSGESEMCVAIVRASSQIPGTPKAIRPYQVESGG